MNAASKTPDVSIVIVSFNTRDLLRECLQSLEQQSQGISKEVFVVDNISRDQSADMVEKEFPEVKLIRSDVNLGFAAANNKAFPRCTGRYVVLLNSDAFLKDGALRKSIAYMDNAPGIGLGGARLTGRDGSWQPSARLFPSPLNDFLTLTGLAGKFPKSRFFGRFDRTWADQGESTYTDWVPGAYSIIRRSVLETVGYFDENFFLYYEEVDLCKRIKNAGYRIRYWGDVGVIHLGGESSKTVTGVTFSKAGSQLTLWRMRAGLLYFRKHHGALGARIARDIELGWHSIRARKNRDGKDEKRVLKAKDSARLVELICQAWKETDGGKVSPPRPWKFDA